MIYSENFAKKLVASFFIVLLCLISAQSIAQRGKTQEVDEAYYDRAWRTFQIGTKNDRSKVISALRSVLRRQPTEFMAHYYLGIMLSKDGSETSALRHLETAQQGFPESADIQVRIAQILEKRRTRVSDAIDHYRKALELDPANGIALSKLGIYQYEQGNLDEAYRLLSMARQVLPENVEMLRALGAVITESGSALQAIEILEQALLFDERDAETHWLLAKAYEKNRQAEKAAEHYEQARRLGRRAPEVRELIGYDLGRSLHQSGRYEDAIKEYQREIRRNDKPAIGWSELGLVYHDIGRDDDAIKAWLKAYELDRSYASEVMKAGEIYLSRDDYEKAKEMFEMIRRDHNLGEEAKNRLSELEDLKENLERARLQRDLHLSTNTDADIIATYEQLLDIDRNNVDALQGLVDFYEQRGYYDEARSYYRRLIKVRPVSETLKKRRLDEMLEKRAKDNQRLWGTRGTGKLTSSKIDESDLRSLAFGYENDRVRETALHLILRKRGLAGDRDVLNELLRFYEERGNVSEALKVVTRLRRHGHMNDYEANAKRKQLRSN